MLVGMVVLFLGVEEAVEIVRVSHYLSRSATKSADMARDYLLEVAETTCGNAAKWPNRPT